MLGDFPDPDFIWATTQPAGDRTASGGQGDPYRTGKTRLVRFAFDRQHFFPWSSTREQFPSWTRSHVGRLEMAAEGKSDPATWWYRADPLPLALCLGIETRSYQDKLWRPLSVEAEVLVGKAPGAEGWMMVKIGDTVFGSAQRTDSAGRVGYEILSFRDPHRVETTSG